MIVRLRERAGRKIQMVVTNPLTGKEKVRTSGTFDKKEAQRQALLWEQELQSAAPSSAISWDSFRSKFEAEHLASCPGSTSRAYGTALNHFERLIGSPKKLAGVTSAVLSEFKGKLLGDLASEESDINSMTSVCSYLQHVCSALSWAQGVGLIGLLPTVAMPRRDSSVMRGRPVTDEEFAAWKDAAKAADCDKPEELAFVLDLLWLSGLRLGEQEILSWTNPPFRVDLDGGRHPRFAIQSRGQKNRTNQYLPMAPDFADWLRKIPVAARKGRVCFVHRNKKPLTANDVGRLISAAGEAAGIVVDEEAGRHATAHDLRRTFGTRWAPRVMPAVLQKMMRHKQIATTMQFYIDIDADDIGDVLAKVSKKMSK